MQLLPCPRFQLEASNHVTKNQEVAIQKFAISTLTGHYWVRPLGIPQIGLLERNIVVHVVELAGRLLGGHPFARGDRLLRFARAFAPARVARAQPAAEHLHAVGDDFGRIALLAFLVLPFARAQRPFDVDLRALIGRRLLRW